MLHQRPPTSSPEAQTPWPGLHLNWEDWLPYLNDPNATEAEKRQLIETLWQIVMGFFDLNCNLRPDAHACGQNLDLTAMLNAAVVHSKDSPHIDEERT